VEFVGSRPGWLLYKVPFERWPRGLAIHVLEVIYINDVDGIPLIQSVRLICWPLSVDRLFVLCSRAVLMSARHVICSGVFAMPLWLLLVIETTHF
jgi:hypothetical protein